VYRVPTLMTSSCRSGWCRYRTDGIHSLLYTTSNNHCYPHRSTSPTSFASIPNTNESITVRHNNLDPIHSSASVCSHLSTTSVAELTFYIIGHLYYSNTICYLLSFAIYYLLRALSSTHNHFQMLQQHQSIEYYLGSIAYCVYSSHSIY
jgi:hypothetical protein